MPSNLFAMLPRGEIKKSIPWPFAGKRVVQLTLEPQIAGIPQMSVLGQKQTSRDVWVMSALPSKADIAARQLDVRFVP